MRPRTNMPPDILRSPQQSAAGASPPLASSRLEAETQSRRQEMIRRISGGVAADFSNLLTVIETGQALVGKYSSDIRIARVLEVNRLTIDTSRRRLAQLLAFSRQQDLLPAATDVNATISVFRMLIEKAIGANRRVQWRLADGLPPAFIDAGQLQSALLSLIANARDATLDNGTITIFTEAKTGGSVGQYVVLGVSDGGAGMSPEASERAIEPFYTTRKLGHGAGLGLSQCDGFARQSGGALAIESVEGNGTTVRMLLPAPGLPETPVSPRTPGILLIDDAFAIRSLVAEMLRGLGHFVLEAEDAHDAMNQLQSNASIDLLFTDVIMPDGNNGLQLPAMLAAGFARDVLRNINRLQAEIAADRAVGWVSEA